MNPNQPPGYPPPGYGAQTPGYPPQGYPNQPPGYPPPQGYGAQTPGYPPQQGYPQQAPQGYPQHTPPGYPPQGADPYAKIGDVTVYQSGEYVTPGQHVFKVRNISSRPSDKKHGVTVFVAELECVKSIGGRALATDPQNQQLSAPIGIGAMCAHVCTSDSQMFLQNVKAFMGALLPGGVDSVTNHTVIDATGPSQPFAGRFVYADASIDRAKSTGKDFTRISWFPAENAPPIPDPVPQPPPQGYGAPPVPQPPPQGYGAPPVPQPPPQGYGAPPGYGTGFPSPYAPQPPR